MAKKSGRYAKGARVGKGTWAARLRKAEAIIVEQITRAKAKVMAHMQLHKEHIQKAETQMLLELDIERDNLVDKLMGLQRKVEDRRDKLDRLTTQTE
jgi:hypothetical protein